MASSNDMATIMVSSNDIVMIIIIMVINRVVAWLIFQRTLRERINRGKGRSKIVASSNDMATIIASSNDISMILIMTFINGVVVRSMCVTPFMISLTSITMEGVAVRGDRMVVLTDITILGILLSA